VTTDRALVVAGATGHVGSALVRRLTEEGRRVRCIVRDPRRLPVAADDVEVVTGDLRDPAVAAEASEAGCVLYFLVHALAGVGTLADEERALAENVAGAARSVGAARIVYLGGLVDESEASLSEHMASRLEVGRVLRASGVQTIELRASIVIGAGSFSFDLIRQVVDNLPLIVLPDWTDNLAQPIALGDVVSYLRAAADVPVEGSPVVEIGGPEQISYRELIERYATATSARRLTAAVPVPRLAADAATRLAAPLAERLPGEAQEALRLLESLRHVTVVRSGGAERFGVQPTGIDEAIAAALRH
jgi:uncharacterized protein YbjT (DUF2867 family)